MESSIPSGSRTRLLQRHAWWLSLVPFGLWLVAWAFPWPMEPIWVLRAYRICGYLSAAALLVPYLHIARTVLPGRLPLGGQTGWLRWHIGAAFVAFLLVLIHCRGHANGFWTLLLLALFWLVMLSGVIGCWVRALIYRYLAITLRPEYGQARLRTKERLRLQRRAARLITEYWKLTEYDIGHWPSFCQDLSEKSGLAKSLWDQAAKEKGSEDAERMLNHIRTGGAFQFGEPNPVIGTLAIVFKRAKCCKLADFQTLATANSLPTEEASRRNRLRAVAELVFQREATLKTLETCLGALAGQLTDAQLLEHTALWQEWPPAKNPAMILDAGTWKKHRELSDGIKKTLGLQLKWSTDADLKKTLAACDKLELPAVGAAQFSSREAKLLQDTCRDIRELLVKFPGLSDEMRGRLTKVHKAADALAKGAVGVALSAVEIQQFHEWRKQVDEVWASDPIAQAGKCVEAAATLLKVVKKMIDDEIGKRNRLFLEMVCPQVVESRPPSPVVLELYEKKVKPRLVDPSPSWGWLFTPAAREAVPDNYLQAARVLIAPQEERILKQLVRWTNRRRQLDVEDWTDRLANHWLRWHAFSAALLFAAVVDHIVGSIRFGGY